MGILLIRLYEYRYASSEKLGTDSSRKKLGTLKHLLVTRFPLHIRSTRELKINEAPIVTVVGKAFWDIGHAPKDQSNRTKYLPEYAVWEIHPVIKLTDSLRRLATWRIP